MAFGFGDALSIGANLLGGILGNDSREDVNNANLNFAREQQAQNIALQKEFAQHGIQWRIEDAKAAGVHPMYALGGGGAAFSPNPVVMPFTAGNELGESLKGMSQDIRRSVAAQETDEQRLLTQAQLDKLRSESAANDAQAAYYASMAKRNELENGVAKAFPVTPTPTIIERPLSDVVQEGTSGSSRKLTPVNKYGPGDSGKLNVKGADQLSSQAGDPSRLASRNPAFEDHVITPFGLRFSLPRSDEGPGETWGELSWYDKLGLFLMNMGNQPEGWTRRFYNEFLLNQAPEYRTNDSRAQPRRRASMPRDNLLR